MDRSKQFRKVASRDDQGRRLLSMIVALGLTALLISSCGPHLADSGQTLRTHDPRPLLNSERIERRFGSYGIEVLESDAGLRVSNLYSSGPAGWICRTFAVVRYPAEVEASFVSEHGRIVAGGSIGVVFKESGWLVEKRHRYFGELETGSEARRVLELMGLVAPLPLAIHVYDLVVTKSGASFDYATIAEVHHPDYLAFEDFQTIFGGAVWAHSSLDDSTRRFLELVSLKMKPAS